LNKGYTHEAELYIYSIDSLKLENIKTHKMNPIYIDCRKARNGGGIFKYENSYFRPSQINIHGIYGRGLQISKIKKLTINEYEDEHIISIEPNFQKGLIGIHHLHQLPNNFIFEEQSRAYLRISPGKRGNRGVCMGKSGHQDGGKVEGADKRAGDKL
jgi:hypothetical protein